MYTVYILYSNIRNRYYIGQTEEFQTRFKWHKERLFVRGYTMSANDWEPFLLIECISRKQAVNIERHIKRMKSKTYILNLAKYGALVEKLKFFYPE